MILLTIEGVDNISFDTYYWLWDYLSQGASNLLQGDSNECEKT